MDLDKIKKIDWEKIVGRKIDLQKVIQFTCKDAGGFGGFFGIKDLQRQLYYFDGRVTSIYFSKKEYSSFLNKAHNRLEDIEFIKRCNTEVLKIFESCFNRGETLSNQVKYKSDKKELLRIFKKFDDIWNDFYPMAWLFFFIDGFEFRLEKKLIKSGYNSKIAKDIIQICAFPDRLIPIMEAEFEILNLANAIKRKKGSVKEYAVKLSKKFGWMSVYNTEDKERQPIYYLNEAKKIIKSDVDIDYKIKVAKEKTRKNKIIYLSYINKLSDKLLKEQLKFFHLSGYLRDKREEFRDRLTILEKSLYMAIARKCRISVNEIVYLTNKEIELLLLNGGLRAELKNFAQKRLKQYILVNCEKLEIIDDKNKITKIKRIFNVNNNIKKIKGNVAYRQLAPVNGYARIILNNKELDKIKKGDILVATMTKPDYLSAMKKASAIITDEGGITCHAAIVARELNILCIIGTKIATQVLKDGDLVEVDANKGVVKILKRQK